MRVCLAYRHARVPARHGNPDLGCKLVQRRFGWSCEARTTFLCLRRLHLSFLFRGRFLLTAHPCPPFLGSHWVQQSPPPACFLCATLSENFGALLVLRQILVRRSSIVGTAPSLIPHPPWLGMPGMCRGRSPSRQRMSAEARMVLDTKHDPPRRDARLEGV